MYEKLIPLLKKHGITLHALAVKLNITYSCLSDWKNGKSKPKADKLKKIADYFGVPLDYFY